MLKVGDITTMNDRKSQHPQHWTDRDDALT
jgi:hypothetical protein